MHRTWRAPDHQAPTFPNSNRICHQDLKFTFPFFSSVQAKAQTDGPQASEDFNVS